MAIKTKIATHFFWRQVIVAVACVVLSVWGAYDLWVKLPYQADNAAKFERYDELQGKAETGRLRDPAEQAELAELEKYTDTHEKEEKPAAFDHLMQWMFIGCILWVPWCLFQIHRYKKKTYELDDAGNLHLPDDDVWQREEIADIDMCKWMAKSIAWVEHSDGKRVKLDAYLHKNLELIIGEIAHRFYPDEWNQDATAVALEDDDDALTEEHQSINGDDDHPEIEDESEDTEIEQV